MPKVFLSHSSKDKEHYVKVVADKLIKKIGIHNVIYDEYTFEKGMMSIEEIEEGLDKTNLFVLFISDTALQSPWVDKEIKRANELLNEDKLDRIYPIIIDSSITYNDKRIPEWMQKKYNIKLITRPTKATNMIIQRLVEISYLLHPRIKEKENIFVGRNDYIKEFEERIDSFDKNVPLCLIASGIKNIGRYSFLRHCLKKTNIIREAYQPPIIYINGDESLEDFIFKLYDLGLSEKLDLTNFMSKLIDEKKNIAIKIIEDIQKQDEKIFVRDEGCIINHEGMISNWFLDIINSLSNKEKITFCIISKFRFFAKDLWKYDYIYAMELAELERKERNGLLKRYAEFEGLILEVDDMKFVSNLLMGYPEQIFYAVELIKKRGIKYLKDNADLLVEYNNHKASTILTEYENDQRSMQFLYLLSQFDYIDMEFIFDIVGKDSFYKIKLNEFLNRAICEYAGINKEYIRMNDTIRDYLQRSDGDICDDYKKKLKIKLNDFLLNPNIEAYNVPQFLFSMKESLLSGQAINEKFLIPSIYLKTMIELYEKNNSYPEVIRFASKALENEMYMDERIIFELRYLLCLSLAKTQNYKMLDVVQKITGADHNFLLAFFYRQVGKNDKALQELNKSLEIRNNFSKAKRELVQVYMNLQEYNKATELAKENYESYKDNPYHIQAYFICLIKGEKSKKNEIILKELIDNLSMIKSEKAKEMLLRCKAEYEAFYNENEELAICLINKAISEYPYLNYAQSIKFDICEKFNRVEEMKNIVSFFKKEENYKKYHNTVVCFESILKAKNGNVDEAMKYFNQNIRNYTDQAKERFSQKLLRYLR